jgi:AraC-like DNA-binding protein
MNKFRLPEGFLAKLRSVRIDPAFLLHKSGLPPTLCSCGDGMVSPEQFFSLWHTLGEVTDDPAIGLRMATLNPPRHPSTIAAQHSRTFGDALPHLARSTVRYFSEHMRIVKTKNECSIEFTGVLLNEGAPALFLDTAFALVLETGRRGTRLPLHPQRVELTRKVSHQEIYEVHYGCVRLKARRNSIVFRTDDLELPFATYNSELLATLNPQLECEMASRKTQQTTSFRAKRMLKRLLGGQHADIDEVAKELGMSRRTLQRRIAEEDSSFRQLLSDTRRELARLYLQHPSLRLSETASLLGYEDPNSFLRVPSAGRCGTHGMESDAKGGTAGNTGSAPAAAGLTSPGISSVVLVGWTLDALVASWWTISPRKNFDAIDQHFALTQSAGKNGVSC